VLVAAEFQRGDCVWLRIVASAVYAREGLRVLGLTPRGIEQESVSRLHKVTIIGRVTLVTLGCFGALTSMPAGSQPNQRAIATWPLRYIVLLLVVCARINRLFLSSYPPALPTLFQYGCKTIGQYTTPPRPPDPPLE